MFIYINTPYIYIYIFFHIYIYSRLIIYIVLAIKKGPRTRIGAQCGAKSGSYRDGHQNNSLSS